MTTHDHSQGYCADAVRDLYLFLDAELDEGRMVQIRAHLEQCSPCFEAFDFEAELRIVVSTRAARSEMPEEFRARLLTMLESIGSSGDASPTCGGGSEVSG